MKQLLILSAMIFSMSCCYAQNAKQTSDGNYTAIKAADKKPATNTGKTFTTASGEVLPVYQSERGKLFVIRTSKKTGNEYKQYLKVN